MKRRQALSHAMAGLLGLSLLASVFGCAIQQHIGSVSKFDSSTADTLHDVQGVLEGLSANIADYPAAKPAINDAREYYTVAERTYLQWRCAVGATQTLGPTGAPCPTPLPTITQNQVTAALNAAQRRVSTAQAQTTGGK